PSDPARVWYFGGLQLLPEHRGQGLGPAFAKAMLEHRDLAGRFAYPLRLIGSAYSPGGEKLMRGFGFRLSQAAQSAGMRIFSLECATREALHAALAGRHVRQAAVMGRAC